MAQRKRTVKRRPKTPSRIKKRRQKRARGAGHHHRELTGLGLVAAGVFLACVLWLGLTGDASDVGEGERPLTPIGDGDFRVGEDWSPDRVRFDAVVDGRATRAVLDAAPFYRTFAG